MATREARSMAAGTTLRTSDGALVLQVPQDEPATIGRSPDATLRIQHGGVSRAHGRLWWEDGHLYYDDVGSATGSWVNGVEVRQPTPLTDGDSLQLGPVTLRLMRLRDGSSGWRAWGVTEWAAAASIVAVVVGLLAWLLPRSADAGSSANGEVGAYRQLVAATCARVVAVRSAEMPMDVVDLSASGIRFRKGPLILELRRRVAAMDAELDSVWGHEPPADLRAQQQGAKDSVAAWSSRLAQQIQSLEAGAPDPMTPAQASPPPDNGDVQIRAKVNDAMSTLSGQNCPVSA